MNGDPIFDTNEERRKVFLAIVEENGDTITIRKLVENSYNIASIVEREAERERAIWAADR